MRVIDAVFGAVGVMLVAGTGYAVASSDLGGGQPVAGQMQEFGEHSSYRISASSDERRGDRDDDDRRGAMSAQLSLQDAINKANEMGLGRVIEAEYEHGRYELDVLDAEGRRMEVYIDANDGRMLKKEFDD